MMGDPHARPNKGKGILGRLLCTGAHGGSEKGPDRAPGKGKLQARQALFQTNPSFTLHRPGQDFEEGNDHFSKIGQRARPGRWSRPRLPPLKGRAS